MAVNSKDLNLIKYIMNCQNNIFIDINQCDNEQCTPLLKSILNESFEITEFFLSLEGIDINKADQYGVNPVIAVIKKNVVNLFYSILTNNAFNNEYRDLEGVVM
ncbi:cardiac ankyrin repeat protein [Tritrichomonas foetus]|uniref:Cardiac ankyrin repeat protein n=1 Tax=Tritrichomonas foetus TaxID=1144522 RepID=A0A1J4JZE6_9EUKA|nr:cardiac ankyrin repeat protein [Tritrichomonas foetus]|eukprot:OHT03864.1 cardiac ankyrin repeat protein [Tritrichomonas foetus]